MLPSIDVLVIIYLFSLMVILVSVTVIYSVGILVVHIGFDERIDLCKSLISKLRQDNLYSIFKVLKHSRGLP